jgi:hypothetical protein
MRAVLTALIRRLRADDGSVSVIIAPFVLLVCVPLLAATVDVGQLFVSRSAQQNATDQAAKAAAWASCHSGNATTAGTKSAQDNGFVAAGTTNFGRVAGVSVTDRGGGVWGVTIDVDVKGAFSRAVGVQTSRVTTHSAASCQAGTSDAARIHANGTYCADTFEWSGSNITLVGEIHSNNQLVATGSTLTNKGIATYTGTKTESGSGHKWLNLDGTAQPAPAPRKVSATRPMPVNYTIADFTSSVPGYTYRAAPSGQAITAAWLRSSGNLVGNTLATAIYYTNSNIDLSGLTGTQSIVGTATFVAKGTINVDAGTRSIKITAYYKNLAFFTNKSSKSSDTPWLLDGSSHDCNVDVMWVRSNVEVDGLAYIPWAKFNMPGTNSKILGGVVANQMDLGGSNLTLGGGPGGAILGSPGGADLVAWQ